MMSALDDCYNIFDLREAAQRRLPRGVFEFVDRATEDHLAVRDNRTGFEDIKLRHRALVDVSGRSTATTLFGKPVALPMVDRPDRGRRPVLVPRRTGSWPRRRRRRGSR